MIPALVFSRDRACQLDALLDSIREYAPIFDPIRVLYTSTDVRFEDGYRRCAALHSAAIFVREANFREDVLLLLTSDQPVCFFTDDDILYRWVPAAPLERALADDTVVTFSLRLGLNSRHCYPLDQPQPLPPIDERDGYVTWRWSDAALDYGYPLSLDGHVLRGRDIVSLLDGSDFTNPNELEDVLARHASRLRHRPLAAALPLSALVGVPINRVNVTHPNRFGAVAALGARTLNERFLAGERIDRLGMDFGDVFGAHQELALTFTGSW